MTTIQFCLKKTVAWITSTAAPLTWNKFDLAVKAVLNVWTFNIRPHAPIQSQFDDIKHTILTEA